MKKEEIIGRYGETEYKRQLELSRQWEEANPDKVEGYRHSQNRKGGGGYEKNQRYKTTGLQGERNVIRNKHSGRWREFKKIIAPGSQCHHQWVFGTSQYRGVALVEADQHRHGNIDVIRILDGKITVFTEKELREQEEIEGEK